MGRMARSATKLSSSLQGTGRAADVANTKLNRLARTMRSMRTMKYGLGGLGAGLGSGLLMRTVGRTLLGYEKAMNLVNANMLDTMDQDDNVVLKGAKNHAESLKLMDMMRKETRRIAQVSVFDPAEVAAGLLELARAGITAKDSMKMLHPAIRLAGAADIAPGKAVDIATNITKSFGLDIERTSEVVDVLAMAVSNTNTNLLQLSEAMKYAAPSSFTAGQNLHEITAVLMTLAQVGQKGSSAGNSIARIMESLYKSSGPAVKALKTIGMSQDDFLRKDGKAIPIAEIMEKLSSAAKEFGNKKVQQAIQALFQARGGRGAKILIEMLDIIAEKRALLEKSAKRAAFMESAMMKGVSGAYEKMRASLANSIISLGEGGFSADLEYLMGLVKSLADGFSELSAPTKQLVGRIMLAVTAFSMLIIPLGIFIWAIGAIAPMLMMIFSPLVILTTAVLALGVALTSVFSQYWDGSELQSLFSTLSEKVGSIKNSLLNGVSWDNPFVSFFTTAIDYATRFVEILLQIPKFLVNPVQALKDSAQVVHGTATGAVNNSKGLFDFLSSGDPSKSSLPGQLAKSQANKELSIKSKVESKVTVTAPPSITLLGSDGSVRGKIDLGASADRGRTQVESAASP